MAFSVSAFRNHFAKHNDFAKPSKFDVRITAPTGLGLNASDLRFQCETTELPGYTINTVDGRYYGVASPVASFPTFADLTLTFICAGDFWEKKLFDRWMNLVIPINNYNPNYRETYIAQQITINQYSEVAGQNNTAPVIYSVSFFEAFPTAIAPMNVNWGDDGVHRLAVTFRYEWWNTSNMEQTAQQVKDRVPVTPPKAQSGSGGSTPASGSTPPITTPSKRSDPPVPPIKGRGGTFAGGGATGGW